MNLFFLIACFGLCQILMYATILNIPRNFLKKYVFFKELLECALCTGTHIGWALYLITFDTFRFSDMIICSLASAGFCFFFELLLELIIAKKKI